MAKRDMATIPQIIERELTPLKIRRVQQIIKALVAKDLEEGTRKAGDTHEVGGSWEVDLTPDVLDAIKPKSQRKQRRTPRNKNITAS